MIYELKYNLVPLLEDIECSEFIEGNNKLTFIYSGVKLEGSKNEIIVFYEPNSIGILRKSNYLNKENTIKKFKDVTKAIGYLKYLVFVLSDSRHEIYYYFNLKLEKINLTYESSQLHITGNNQYLRCDISGLNLRGIPLKFNFLLIIDRNNLYEFSFYPENPLWDEGKVLPEKNIDEIINYIKKMDLFNYEDIQIQET